VRSGRTPEELAHEGVIQMKYYSRIWLASLILAVPAATLATGTSTDSISSLSLINTDTNPNQVVSGFEAIAKGVTLDLSTLPGNFSIRASTSPSTVGKVVFSIPDLSYSHTENRVPYDLCSDQAPPNGSLALPCSVLHTLGSHTLVVTPYDSSGNPGTSTTNDFTVVNGPTSTNHYMYIGVAPSVESPSIPFQSGIYVYDIDNGHSLFKTIPLPSGPAAPADSNSIAPVYSIRGMVADPKSQTLYITHYGSVTAQNQGYLLALDLTTGQEKWQMSFSPTNPNPLQNSAVDRGCMSPDGKTIYVPSGEAVKTTGFWYEIDTATHTVRTQLPFAADDGVPGAHNTICSADGRVFMEAIAALGSTGNADNQHSVKIYTPGSDEINNPGSGTSSYVGAFSNRVRPFSINGNGSLIFATLEDFIGFQVGEANTLTTLPETEPLNYIEPTPNNTVPGHGVAVTYDNKEVWVVDSILHWLHYFDVSGVPSSAPVYIGHIWTANGTSYHSFPQPGWIMATRDNQNSAGVQFFYAETGEIINTQTKVVVGYLRDQSGNRISSRYGLEVDFTNGVPTRAGDQFAIGR
jgi:hypothetical protein